MRILSHPVGIWGPPILIMAVIFALSAMPAGDPQHAWYIVVVRKIAHFSEYALLLAFWWRALATRMDSGRALLVAFAISVGYAATDEFHQTFVEGRYGTPRDVLIDSTGAAAAAAVIWLTRVRRTRASSSV